MAGNFYNLMGGGSYWIRLDGQWSIRILGEYDLMELGPEDEKCIELAQTSMLMACRNRAPLPVSVLLNK
jgi:hypothetical protein